ncbi:MAG: ABC transporter permease [Anaerolineae bacterium]|nr:ABC transporter permease [Anaerolineae bacterium]
MATLTTLRRKMRGDLRAQWGAFLAVWLTAVVGLAFYGSTYPAGIAMIDSMFATYDQFGYADFTAEFEAAPAAAVHAAVEPLLAREDVAAVAVRTVTEIGVTLAPDAPARLTLRLIGLPTRDDGAVLHPAVNDVLVTQGELPDAPGEILLIERFATYHGLQPGDTVQVWTGDTPHDLAVRGYAFGPEYIVMGQGPLMPFPIPSSFGVGYLRDVDLAALIDASGTVNSVAVRLREGTSEGEAEAVRTALSEALAPFEPDYLYSRVQTASGGVIDANIKGDMAVAGFLSVMFLVISGLVMAVLLARLMDAEKRRIGTMRALGLSRAEALRHYLSYPLLIGISAALAGSLAGYLGSFFVAHFFINTLTGGSLPTFINTPQWGYIGSGAGVVVALALIAGALPTWRASGTAPGLALRPITPHGLGAQARVSLPGLPLAAQQAVRNTLRAPVRSLNTLLGVLLGCVVILSTSGTADTTIRMYRAQYVDTLHFDIQVTWEAFDLAENRRILVADLPGVAGVEVALAGPATVRLGERSLDTFAISMSDRDDFYTFNTLAGDPAFTRDDVIWIGQNLARVLQAGPGDTLTLEALGQQQHAEVAGVVEQAFGSVAYVPADLMASWTPLGVRLANLAFVRTEPGQLEAAQAALAGLDGVVSVDVLPTYSADLWAYLSLWANFSYMFQLFGYVLTLLVVFNTISINLHERREELAIMRALGATLGEIGRTITWETLSVTVLGMVLSLPLGWIALGWMMQNYDLDFFGSVNTVAPASYLIAAGGIVAVVLAAEWLGLRTLRGVDLGALSKTLSS